MKSEAKRRTCTLMITHKCNLNCTYCYEKFKSDKSMPFELAKKIIDKEFEFVRKSDDFDEIEFDFMGGEPFVNFELIKKITDYVWSKEWNVPYLFFATTNATLIDDNIKEWLKEHKLDFVLGLSFDGKPETQNANRSKSSTNIDMDFFLKLYPFQPIKMTVSPSTVKTLSEDVIYLHSKDALFSVNCAYGQEWTEENFKEYELELLKLAKFYLENLDITPISLFDNKLHFIEQETKVAKYCGTGTSMITYDTDGNEYPCHMFSPIVMGEKYRGNIYDMSEKDNLLDSFCDGCIFLNICPTCYGFNFKERGDIALREPANCRLFQINMEVYSYFIIELIKKKIKEDKPISHLEEKEAKSILFLNKNKEKIKERKFNLC